jgi:hypothetical protein
MQSRHSKRFDTVAYSTIILIILLSLSFLLTYKKNSYKEVVQSVRITPNEAEVISLNFLFFSYANMLKN